MIFYKAKEKKPENSGEYIILTDDMEVTFAAYNPTMDTWHKDGGRLEKEVIGWASLPRVENIKGFLR